MTIFDPHGRPLSRAGDGEDRGAIPDEQLAELTAAEIAAKVDKPCIVALDALAAFTFAKLLQIAVLHPDVRDDPHYAGAGRELVDLVREYFADAPHVLEQLRRGDALVDADPTPDEGRR